MYPNLIKLLEERHITPPRLARMLDVDDKSARNKLSGITEFKLSEMRVIMDLFPEYRMEWLFAAEKEGA